MVRKTSDDYCPENRKGHSYRSRRHHEFSKRKYRYMCRYCDWIKRRKK